MTTPIPISPQIAQDWAEQYWGISVVQIKALPGEVDYNFHLTTKDKLAYTFKVSRPDAEQSQIDLQQATLDWINQETISVQLPYPILNLQQQLISCIQDANGQKRFLRMVHWVPGQVLAKTDPKSLSLLEEIGQASAQLAQALQSFDHPAAHRFFKWDIAQAIWTKEHASNIQDPQRQTIFSYFIDRFTTGVLPQLSQLRSSVIHNDVNDYNVLVQYEGSIAKISGIIDFGDTIYTQTINELAIAIAYGIMDMGNPLEAAAVMVKGFHTHFPLLPEEIELLYDLIALRLVVSVTNAAINKLAEPENTYLLISEQPAWDLLEKWKTIPPALVHYTLRHACGWEPCPQMSIFRAWVKAVPSTPFLLDVDLTKTSITNLDLSVGSASLGNNHNFDQTDRFHRTINRILEDSEAHLGVGGYGEIRPFYTTDAYQVAGNNGPEWRTLHLGLDIWGQAGIPVIAPLAGIVHSIQNNAGDCDYGPTIILKHQPVPTLTFYTLYGHLSQDSLNDLQPGDAIQAGQQIAKIGDFPVNGNWPPHLHFQIMLDLLEWEGDFPGVAFPNQAEVWQSICPDPDLLLGERETWGGGERETVSIEKIRAIRENHLGKGMSVSYNRPLHILRGFGPYLYDQDGRRYLDTVNNVAHVGHEHPKVVRVGQQQMGLLNTNTRYLHQNITALAEELLATFPPELSVVHFVNSGSEANELALRMARTFHGHSDMIAVEVGYHGNTNGCIDISSYKFDGKGGQGTPEHTQIVPIPDTYRGMYRSGAPEVGQRYAAHIDDAIARINEKGRKVAAFICESILSCGGQIVLPPNYLKAAYAAVRRIGGLCIADEVQVGFGRVGTHFWGFELQGVIPDIVTMGKPMGNGHPLAAVVCTQEVADTFANGMEYFNTFGGNPISAAIGRAVLAVIQEEGLQENALETGQYLRQGLSALQDRYPIIGDVRGPGFFQGIELIKDRDTLHPAAAETAYIANRMRRLGILMSTDGPLHNVLKIKPPMCFKRKHVDFLVGTLDKVLQEDFVKRSS